MSDGIVVIGPRDRDRAVASVQSAIASDWFLWLAISEAGPIYTNRAVSACRIPVQRHGGYYAAVIHLSQCVRALREMRAAKLDEALFVEVLL